MFHPVAGGGAPVREAKLNNEISKAVMLCYPIGESDRGISALSGFVIFTSFYATAFLDSTSACAFIRKVMKQEDGDSDTEPGNIEGLGNGVQYVTRCFFVRIIVTKRKVLEETTNSVKEEGSTEDRTD